MTDHVYKSVELAGRSPDGIQKAVENAISRAGETIRNIRWFEISQVGAKSKAARSATGR